MALTGYERAQAYRLGRAYRRTVDRDESVSSIVAEWHKLSDKFSGKQDLSDWRALNNWYIKGQEAAGLERTKRHSIRRKARKALRKRKGRGIPAHLLNITKKRKRA